MRFEYLAFLGVVESTNENGEIEVQRIDDPLSFALENNLPQIPSTLSSDQEAKDIWSNLDNILLSDIQVSEDMRQVIMEDHLKEWEYVCTGAVIWTSWDHGTVMALGYEDAKQKALRQIKYDIEKANHVLESADVTQGFNIEFNLDNLEVTLKS
jgi:hypothetical protein